MPGLYDKLSQSWEGPYRVRKRIRKVNYEVEGLEAGRKKKRVLHVNK